MPPPPQLHIVQPPGVLDVPPVPNATPQVLVPPPGYTSSEARPEFPAAGSPITSLSHASGGYLISPHSSSPFRTDSQFFVPHSVAPVPDLNEARIPETDICFKGNILPGQQQPSPHEGQYSSVSTSHQAQGQDNFGSPDGGAGYDVISGQETQPTFSAANSKEILFGHSLQPGSCETQLSLQLNREAAPFSHALLEHHRRSAEARQISNNVPFESTSSGENQIDDGAKFSNQCRIDQNDSLQRTPEGIHALNMSHGGSEDPEMGGVGQGLTGSVMDTEQQCQIDLDEKQIDLNQTDQSQHDVFKRPYLPIANDNIRSYHPNRATQQTSPDPIGVRPQLISGEFQSPTLRTTQNILRRPVGLSGPSNIGHHDSQSGLATGSETQDYQQAENVEMNESNFYSEMQKDIWGSMSHFPVLLDGMNENNSASGSASDAPVDLSSDTGTDSSPVDLSFKTSDDEDCEMDSVNVVTEENMKQQSMNSVVQQGFSVTNWSHPDGQHLDQYPDHTQPDAGDGWGHQPTHAPDMRHDVFFLKPDVRHLPTDQDKTSDNLVQPMTDKSEKPYNTFDMAEAAIERSPAQDKNTVGCQPSSNSSKLPKMQPLALPHRRGFLKPFRIQWQRSSLQYGERQNSPMTLSPSRSRTFGHILPQCTPPDTPKSTGEYAHSPGTSGTPGQSTRCSTPTLSGSLAYTPPTTPTDTSISTSNVAPPTAVEISAIVNPSGALIHVTLPTVPQDDVKPSNGKLAGLLTYIPPEFYGELRAHKSGQKVKDNQTVKQSPEAKRLQHGDISRLLPIIKISQGYIQKMHTTKIGDSMQHTGFKIVYELFNVRSILHVNNDNSTSQNKEVAPTSETNKPSSAEKTVAQKSPRLRQLLSEKEKKFQFQEELFIIGYKLPNSNSQQINTLAIQNSKPFLVKLLPRISKHELLLAKKRLLLNRYKQKLKQKQQQHRNKQQEQELIRQQAVKTLKQYKPFRKVRFPTTGQLSAKTIQRQEASTATHKDKVTGEKGSVAQETDSTQQHDLLESVGSGMGETLHQHLKRAGSVLNLSVQANGAEFCDERPAKRWKSESGEKIEDMEEKDVKIEQEDADTDQCSVLDSKRMPETTGNKKMEKMDTSTQNLTDKVSKNKGDLQIAKKSKYFDPKNAETPRTPEKVNMIYRRQKVGDLDRVIHKLKREGIASAGKQQQ